MFLYLDCMKKRAISLLIYGYIGIWSLYPLFQAYSGSINEASKSGSLISITIALNQSLWNEIQWRNFCVMQAQFLKRMLHISCLICPLFARIVPSAFHRADQWVRAHLDSQDQQTPSPLFNGELLAKTSNSNNPIIRLLRIWISSSVTCE